MAKPDWYGLDHEAVKQRFEGDLTFINEFCVNGEYEASAVYKAASPNLEKGHKEYVLLTKSGGQWFVRGMTAEQIEEFRYQAAIHCLECDDVIYSVNRHDFRHCTCGKTGIDGGKDYLKVSFQPGAKHARVTLDLITDAII